MTVVARAPRDFTYITPRKRRLSEYEAVTCYTQPDPEAFDKQGWYLRTAEGRPAWRKESTRLSHPHWFDFRDPAALWQRPYVRMQAEQERSLERAVEDAARGGAFRDFDPIWTREIVGAHYRVWSFFEYGLFRCFAQAIVIYLMDLEDQIEGFRDGGAKQRWLSDPIYQPMRRLTEELMAIEDWAELPVALHLAVDPILGAVGASEIVRHHGAFHGDTVTPQVVATTERDRRRNLEWTQELVRMVTDAKIPAADENREIVKAWIARWTPGALAATEALAPVYERIPNRRGSFGDTVARAQAAQAAVIASLEPKSAEAA